jgi:hypothetical protein
MTIFTDIIAKSNADDRRLGVPALDEMHRLRRMNFFATITKGNGFRQDKTMPKTDAQGKTRGDHKRFMRLFLYAAKPPSVYNLQYDD